MCQIMLYGPECAQRHDGQLQQEGCAEYNTSNDSHGLGSQLFLCASAQPKYEYTKTRRSDGNSTKLSTGAL